MMNNQNLEVFTIFVKNLVLIINDEQQNLEVFTIFVKN